jgi:hypothetical protein
MTNFITDNHYPFAFGNKLPEGAEHAFFAAGATLTRITKMADMRGAVAASFSSLTDRSPCKSDAADFDVILHGPGNSLTTIAGTNN